MSVTINKITQNLQVTKGDSFQFTLRDGDTKLPKVFDPTDIVKFTVKNKVGGTKIIEKVVSPDLNGYIVISIESADTNALALGYYVYDIQWSTETGNVTTLIPRTERTQYVPSFEVCGEVTENEEET